MSYSTIVVKLEGVMINEFNVEECYEKGLRRRVGFTNEVNEEVMEVINPLKEEKNEVVKRNKGFIDNEIKKIKGEINILREERSCIIKDKSKEKEEKDREKEVINNKIKVLNDKIDGLKDYFKNLKLEVREIIKKREEEVREIIISEKNKELDPIREREKELIMKEILKEYDERFEDLKLKEGVKRVFDRLFKLKMVNKELRIIVESKYRSLKVRRLLNNVGLDFCEVVNSNVKDWDKEIKKNSDLLMMVENEDDLMFLVEKVKYEMNQRKRLRA